MGLDVSISLVAGVPLSSLGAIRYVEEEAKTTNHFGRPTGRSVIITRVYLDLPNGRQFLIGTNEESLSDGYNRHIDYTLEALFQDDNDPDVLLEQWVHECYSPQPQENIADLIVIGLAIEPECQGEGEGRYDEAFAGASHIRVYGTLIQAATELERRFGYAGTVYVIAHASYGW